MEAGRERPGQRESGGVGCEAERGWWWKTLEKAGRRSSARGGCRDHDDDAMGPRHTSRRRRHRVGGIRREIVGSTRWKSLTPGGDRAAGRKTLFATRTPVIAGCAPGDAPRASPTRSDERMVSCVRTLRFLEMLPVDILAGWSVLGARQRERVDELDCLFLFQCLRVRQNPLKHIAPREPTRKSEAENLTWRAQSVDRLRVDGELPAGCASLWMPPRVQAHVLAPAWQGGAPRDRPAQGRRARVVARPIGDGTPAQTARLLGRRRRAREPEGKIQEVRRLQRTPLDLNSCRPDPKLDPRTLHSGGG